MLVKTLRKWVGLGLLLASLSAPLKAKELPPANETDQGFGL